MPSYPPNNHREPTQRRQPAATQNRRGSYNDVQRNAQNYNIQNKREAPLSGTQCTLQQPRYNPQVNKEQLYLKKMSREKRRRMLRRRRIAFLGLLICLCLVLFFVLRLVFKKPKPNTDVAGNLSSASVKQPDSVPKSPSLAAASASKAPPSSAMQGIKADLSSWELLLANANNPLPEGFLPELELVDTQQHQFDKRGAAALKKMLSDGNATGLELMICSAYRSHERQTKLFNEMLEQNKKSGLSDEEALAKTKAVRNAPGTSEHETGLAADIVAVKNQNLDESFETTPEFAWLVENCANYGFILRYPREKTAITGTIYEPWHYRYVGVEAAKEIKSRGICLEEFIELAK